MSGLELVRRGTSDSGAVFSPCEQYRYLLWRRWRDLTAKPGVVLWIMLNPSTADELKLDPTLTRCKRYTERFGFAHFQVANLFALRSTEPAALHHTTDPIGPCNDELIEMAIADATLIVVGWGAFPLAAARSRRLVELANGKQMFCLATTRNGSPGHPLYLRADLNLTPWPSAAASPP